MSPGQTEVKQGKFVEFISRVKDYLRETYKSGANVLLIFQCLDISPCHTPKCENVIRPGKCENF